VRDINDSADGQKLSGDRLVPQMTSIGPQSLASNFTSRYLFSKATRISPLQPPPLGIM
jgi:hypothetical protein